LDRQDGSEVDEEEIRNYIINFVLCIINMRVLIGEISSYKAIVIARYIRQYYPKIELLAYDNNPLLQYIHSRYVDDCTYISYTTLTEYIEKLADHVRNNNVDIFIPVHSDYIGTILQHKHLFGRSLDYQGSYSDYIRLHEKDQLMQLARNLQIKTPKEYTLLTDAPIPFVLKPTNLSSAKGIKYIKTNKDKINLSSIPKGLICQEYIQGQGCGYEVYCQNGNIVTEYGHLRLAEWPITGGSSVLRTGYIHPDMRPIAEACADTDTLMEISTWHDHLTVEELKIAAQTDAQFIINSDAHHPKRIGDFEGGLERAFEAGIDLSRIVNLRENK
jgi:hypothetical protein